MEPRKRGRPRKVETNEPGTVAALERGLLVLKELAGSGPQILTDLHLRLGMPAPTVHRLLSTLRRHELAQFDPNTSRWSVGIKAFEIGQSFVQHRDVVGVARPKMDDLMAATGETISLALVDNEEIIFVAQVEPRSSIRAFFPPGERGPLHASGCGKAVLATWADDHVRRALEERGMKVFTPNTRADLPALMSDIVSTRERGWAINDAEHTPGMRCVAAPIFDSSGRAVAAMSISGPIARVPYERLEALGSLLKQAMIEITAGVGGDVSFFSTGSQSTHYGLTTLETF